MKYKTDNFNIIETGWENEYKPMKDVKDISWPVVIILALIFTPIMYFGLVCVLAAFGN